MLLCLYDLPPTFVLSLKQKSTNKESKIQQTGADITTGEAIMIWFFDDGG